MHVDSLKLTVSLFFARSKCTHQYENVKPICESSSLNDGYTMFKKYSEKIDTDTFLAILFAHGFECTPSKF